MTLTVEGVRKSFGDALALDDVALEVADGAFACLLGPSGCGKTTLLRVVAGLEAPDAGRVLLDGRDVTRVPPHERGLGFVFQEGALFPHLTVAENVAFGLRVAKWPRGRREERVATLLDLVGLSRYGERRPDALSGGEKQRVALARALAPEPRMLLMDEPLASLDRALREELRREIRRLHDATGVTTLFVTHDTEEALALADRVHVMRAGRVVDSAPPREAYLAPRTAFAARFLGAANVVHAEARGDGTIVTPLGTGRPGSIEGDADLVALVRPGDVTLAGPEEGVRARVDEVRFLGRHQRVDVTLAKSGTRVFLDAHLDRVVHAGDDVGLVVDWSRVRAIPAAD